MCNNERKMNLIGIAVYMLPKLALRTITGMGLYVPAKEKIMNEQEAHMLKKFLNSDKITCLTDIRLVHGNAGYMLYPTNDLWLTQEQFQVLKSFLIEIGEKEFYVTQFDGSYVQSNNVINESKNMFGIFSNNNPVYLFNLDSKYEEYNNLFLYSVSVLYSCKGTWAILVDETLNSGYGLFLSNIENIIRFKKLCKDNKLELLEDKECECYQRVLSKQCNFL